MQIVILPVSNQERKEKFMFLLSLGRQLQNNASRTIPLSDEASG